MSWVLQGTLPSICWPVILAILAVCFAVLARTRARGGWLAPLASVNCFLLAAESAALVDPELAPWREQVLLMRITELPGVSAICAMCLAQAGVLAWPRRAAVPFGEAATSARLRKVLIMGPFAMFGAWVLALAGQLIWPVPVYDPFAPMTTLDFFVIAPLCLPQMFYLTLLSWILGRAAGPRAPSVRLRAKNASLSIGVFAYLLMVACVVAGLGAEAFAPDGTRRAILGVLFAVDDRLFLLVALTIPLGLALGSAPAAYELLLKTDYPALLKLRPRLEARRWQLAGSGGLRRLTRAIYHANVAADLLEVSDADRERTVATLELLAILEDPPEDVPEITPENMQRCLALQREFLGEGPLAGVMGPPKSSFKDPDERPHPPEDPFYDAVQAALTLAGKEGAAARGLSERYVLSLWFQLAAVVARDAGFGRGVDAPAAETAVADIARRRATHAYQTAREAAATARFG